MATRRHIEDGAIAYIRNYVLPEIHDPGKHLVISVATTMLDKNRNMFDGIFCQPVINSMAVDGEYDVSSLLDAVEETVTMTGSACVTIPAVPLVSPEETKIIFTAQDIANMRRFLQ